MTIEEYLTTVYHEISRRPKEDPARRISVSKAMYGQIEHLCAEDGGDHHQVCQTPDGLTVFRYPVIVRDGEDIHDAIVLPPLPGR